MRQDNLALDRQDTKRGPLKSIGVKLIVSFSLLFVAVLTVTEIAGIKGVPFTLYPGRQEHHRAKAFESLELIADLKQERLLRWIEERRADAYVTFNHEMANVNIISLHTALHKYQDQGKRGTELWALIREKQDYKKLADFLRIIQSAYEAYDRIYVADAETGTTFISTNDAELGTDVSPKAFFINALEGDQVYVSDIAIAPQSQQPALYISNSIKDETGRTISVLVMEINANDIIKPMLHTGEGLGERGEALLVNHDVRILTSLKHPLADGTIAQPLEYQIQAQPAVLAAKGEEGIIETEDYRGEPVLAAYRHIRISSERGWGLVVKQDQAELYAPLKQDMTFSLLTGVIGTLAVIGFTIIIARGLTRPIRALSQAANRVTAGDLDARAPVTTSDEVGGLATTFNAMVERVQHWHVELEEQVQARTVELNDANATLQSEVAERKRAQEALQESEEQYRTLIETMNDGLIILDAEGSITYANDRYCEMMGYSRDEIVGQPIHNVLNETNHHILQEQLARRRKGGHTPYEITYIQKGGRQVHTITSPRPIFDAEGDFRGSFAVVTDITEHKQAEETLRALASRYQAVLTAVPDIIMEVDNYKVYTWANQAGLDFFGQDVLGKEADYYFEGEQKTYDVVQPIFNGDENIIYVESWQRRKDNEKRLLAWWCRTLKDMDGNITGALSSARDITEQKLVEGEREALIWELETLIKELEAKNAELEQFTYTVSHDLKSPLITIKGFLGLLEQDALAGDTERVKADMARISNAADKMQQLLEDLLELSRIGRLVNPSREIELGALVREAADLVAGRLNERGAHLEIAPDLPTIYGDRPRLRAVLENLIDNAVKFMGDQPDPHIEITARRDGQAIVVSVRDNGIGIDPRYHDKIFGLFEKLDQQTEGTGVGLAIVKRTIEVHGGRIWVRSKGIGHGSTFYFTLPESETSSVKYETSIGTNTNT